MSPAETWQTLLYWGSGWVILAVVIVTWIEKDEKKEKSVSRIDRECWSDRQDLREVRHEVTR